MGKRTHHASLPNDEAEIVRADLRDLVRQHGKIKAVADLLGVTPSAITQVVGGKTFGEPKNNPSEPTARAVALHLGKPIGYWRKGGPETFAQPTELARRYELDVGLFVVIGVNQEGAVNIKELDQLPDAVRRGIFGASCLLRMPLERAQAIALELMQVFHAAVHDPSFGPEFWYERIRDRRATSESGSHPTPPGLRAIGVIEGEKSAKP